MSVEEYEMIPSSQVTKYQNPTAQMKSVINTMTRRPGRPRKNENLLSSNDKLVNSLMIALRLAPLSAYDEQNRIKKLDGSVIENSNIISLITNALSPGKNLLGQEEFVKWLKKADIDPSIIVNENIRVRLMNSVNKHNKEMMTTLPPVQTIKESEKIDEEMNVDTDKENTADVIIEPAQKDQMAKIAQQTPLPDDDSDIDNYKPVINKNKNFFQTIRRSKRRGKKRHQENEDENIGYVDNYAKRRKIAWDNNGNV